MRTSVSVPERRPHPEPLLYGRTFGESASRMNTLGIRSEVKRLIDREKDPSVLELIKSILSAGPLNKEMAEDMMRVALLSDEDIAAGRTHTVEEVRRWMAERKRKA